MDIKKLEVRLKEISGGKVLDVATGSGQFIQSLMEALKDYHDFVAIDVHEKALEYAKKQFEGKPVHFVKMDAENLTFENNTFDTVKGDFHDHTYTRDAIRKIMEKLPFSQLEEFDLTYPIEDPKKPEFITKMKASINKALDRYKEIPEFENYKGKVNELIDWIETCGYAPASSLFFIGRKY